MPERFRGSPGTILSLRFLRPLSSGTLALDAWAFGSGIWPVRLHSLLWLLGVLAVASALHARLLPPRIARLATIVYAVAGAHAMPVLWTAARHTLVTAALALAAFYLHVRGRIDPWAPGRVLAPLAFAAALLGGETALGMLALLVAWEAVDRRPPILELARRLSPFLLIAACYLTFYVVAGYGAHGSGGYAALGPTAATLTFALRHWLILLAELAAATPSDPSGAASDAMQWVAAAWGVVTVGLVWMMVRIIRPWMDARDMSALRWMTLAAAAAAAPGALAPIGGRVLTIALLPASGVAALLMARGVAALRTGAITGARKWLVGTAIAGLALGHLVLGPIVRVAAGAELTRIGREQYRVAASIPRCGSALAILAAADPTVSTYAPAMLLLDRRPLHDVRTLSMAPVDHLVERLSATSFDLIALRDGTEPSLWERLYRVKPMARGDRVFLPSFDATVLDAPQGWPTRVRFEFRAPLESGGVCFLQWWNGQLEQVRLPPAGGTAAVPHQPGPMGW